MRVFFAACLLSLPILTACGAMPPLEGGRKDVKRSLNMVELDYPNVTFNFLSTGEVRQSGGSFPPPKTIDCSRLSVKPDAFKDAIEAGALVVRIQTPLQVTYTVKDKYDQAVKDKDGKEITKVEFIKSTYGGVLALCKVSKSATGPDSRRYWIRGLDKYLADGKDGLVSVVAAELSHNNQLDVFGELLESSLGVPRQYTNTNSGAYAWILWLTDRTATFTDYEAEVARRKASMRPLSHAPAPAPAQKQ